MTALHTGPYRSEEVPDLGDAQAALRAWIDEEGILTSRPSERGSSLAACVEHYRVGPPMEADWTKWETELAYLVVEDRPAQSAGGPLPASRRRHVRGRGDDGVGPAERARGRR